MATDTPNLISAFRRPLRDRSLESWRGVTGWRMWRLITRGRYFISGLSSLTPNMASYRLRMEEFMIWGSASFWGRSTKLLIRLSIRFLTPVLRICWVVGLLLQALK